MKPEQITVPQEEVKMASTEVSADFMPKKAERKIQFASEEAVLAAGKGIEDNFSGVFHILAR